MTIADVDTLISEIDAKHCAAYARLQQQFDVLAGAHLDALADLEAATARVAAIERKMIVPVAPDLTDYAKFILPNSERPGRQHFDAAGFLGAIAERQKL
jgi:hypothetical protein